jgi:hypothetical protein
LDKPRKAGRSPGKIHWHPAFFQAIQMELVEYRGLLEFQYEYQLAAEPLRIDTVIVKKPPDLRIDKNIARIFRTWNLFEYKSPGDHLSIRDFHKVYAYACLYAAVTPEAALSDLTLSFVGTRYPRDLVKYLEGERRYRVEERWPGIRVVTGDYLPIQIIETKKLPDTDNLWLKALAYDLETQKINSILQERKKLGQAAPMDAWLDVVLHANPKTFQEVLMAQGALTLEDVLTEAGLIPKWLEEGMEKGMEKGLERGRRETAKNLKAMGLSVDQIAAATGLDPGVVKAL